ncbi:MAG TPA: SCO family protein [Gaiellaceae bacterium]|nr:SCO family protein [Gaiellaceae bacterium]
MRIVLLLAALAGALAVVLGFILTRDDKAVDLRGSQPPDGLVLPDAVANTPAFDGKALAITFLDTQCTEACPIAASQIAEAMRLLGDDRGRVLAVAYSVDPVHDTPASITSFLRRNRAAGEIRYVDGSVASLRKVWSAFQILPSTDTGNSNMHSVPVRVYDSEGRWRSTLHPGVDLTPANLAHDLEAVLE